MDVWKLTNVRLKTVTGEGEALATRATGDGDGESPNVGRAMDDALAAIDGFKVDVEVEVMDGNVGDGERDGTENDGDADSDGTVGLTEGSGDDK